MENPSKENAQNPFSKAMDGISAAVKKIGGGIKTGGMIVGHKISELKDKTGVAVTNACYNLCSKIGIDLENIDEDGLKEALETLNEMAPGEMKKLCRDMTVKLQQKYIKYQTKQEKWQAYKDRHQKELDHTPKAEAMDTMGGADTILKTIKTQQPPNKQEIIDFLTAKYPAFKNLSSAFINNFFDEETLQLPLEKKKVSNLTMLKDLTKLGVKLIKNADELGYSSGSIYSPTGTTIINGNEFDKSYNIDLSTYQFLSSNIELLEEIMQRSKIEQERILNVIKSRLVPAKSLPANNDMGKSQTVQGKLGSENNMSME